MSKSDTIAIKSFNLVFSFIESILARLKSQDIVNPTSYLAAELNTSKDKFAKVLNCDRHITVETLIAMAHSAGLEIEITLRDHKTSECFNYMQIATVDTEFQKPKF